MTQTTLASGEALAVSIEHPPFEKGRASDQLCGWHELREQMISGSLNGFLHAPHFIGRIDGQVVGSMCSYAPADTRDVGLVEFVRTAEQHRRKGVGSALLSALISDFLSHRGKALYLCTTNPAAGALYEKHGFRYHAGDGMRFLAPGAEDFDRTYFDFAGPGTARPATWADLPRASALYNHAEPAWFVKDRLSDSFRDTRYESHFLRTMKAAERGLGAMVALESPQRRLVGMAATRTPENYPQQHAAELSLRLCPSYLDQAGDLLTAVFETARSMGIEFLSVAVADIDDSERSLLRAHGFVEEARLRDRLRVDDGYADLLLYTRRLPGSSAPRRRESDFYGTRKEWQNARIQARREEVRQSTRQG